MLKDRTKVSSFPRVTEVHTHKVARKLQGGKNSNVYALLVTEDQVITLLRSVPGKAELGLE